jgi:molybdopterin converting factor subunit 1
VRLNVLLFASYAEALGASSVGVTLADGATVDDLLAAVRQMAAGTALPPAAVAVNQEYAVRSQRLEPADEVAIIPPVAGG